MNRGRVAVVVVVVLLGLAGGRRVLRQWGGGSRMAPVTAGGAASAAEEGHPSFLYGRVTTVDGVEYEGRLRWGANQEAFWGDYFNGYKNANPWAEYVPQDRLPTERSRIQVFGLEIGSRERPVELGRPFMARFGDLARIDASAGEVLVRLKSGAVFHLNRADASDFDDGVRVWDRKRGVTDLESPRIRTVELAGAPRPGAAPRRLFGTVRVQQGQEFHGFLQWNREMSLGSDELAGQTGSGQERRLRFDDIRSIARPSPDSAVVTLLDGREEVLSGRRTAGQNGRGVYVDDRRYGRVLVSWRALERVDFRDGGSGPAYGDYPPGGPLRGSVTTRDGRRLTGRLVYDLDESEVTDTLDAPAAGVDYTIPFGLIASIVVPAPGDGDARRARLTLHSGEQLELECSGDLGKGNAGVLVFVDERRSPEYVSWADVAEVTLDRPGAMYPPVR